MSQSVTISSDTTVIHVNRGTIDSNRKQDRDLPPLSVRKGKRGDAVYSDRILILGADGQPAGEVVYNKDGILPCGAKAVIIAYHGAEAVGTEH